jgi:hypothetical protein
MTTTHRIAATALLVLSLAAAGAPAASARPAGPEAAGPAHHARALYSRQDKSVLPPNELASSAATTSGPRSEVVSGGGYGSGTAAPVVRVTSPSTGFDWGDAGIGAAGGIALSMIGLGGALAVSQNRGRRTRRTRTTALPS